MEQPEPIKRNSAKIDENKADVANKTIEKTLKKRKTDHGGL